ncbi:MAG: 3-deoxy-D-manno-octulosonic acid transferase [Thermodesulfovibrionales bacterium]|nr:3-deoxy-D-manno-octulosonic acid transferase [Thermodesulfovibrionales bacterium]
MMQALYTLLYLIVVLFLLPFEFLKRNKSIRVKWLKEKFGVIHTNSQKETIWIHAVSVGEVNAIVPLVKKLQDQFSQYNILITTITDTGQEVCRKHLNTSVSISYLPFDIPITLNKTIDSINPKLILICETELWPNLMKIAHKRSIPVMLINGRISERSFKRYQLIKYFMKSVLKLLDFFMMQNDVYKQRIISLGADPSKVCIIGNLKFDIDIPQKSLQWAEAISKRMIIAGSTHEPEEQIILEAFVSLSNHFQDIILVIAPRHPQRFRHVEKIISDTKMPFINRSNITEGINLNQYSIILLDVMGELSILYKYCYLAILGGSFIPHGGQNPLEPAYWGKAIVCGPHMHNFYFIDDFLKVGAAIQTTSTDLTNTLSEILADKIRIQQMGKNAKALVQLNRGAVDRALDIIKGYL